VELRAEDVFGPAAPADRHPAVPRQITARPAEPLPRRERLRGRSTSANPDSAFEEARIPTMLSPDEKTKEIC